MSAPPQVEKLVPLVRMPPATSTLFVPIDTARASAIVTGMGATTLHVPVAESKISAVDRLCSVGQIWPPATNTFPVSPIGLTAGLNLG